MFIKAIIFNIRFA